MKLALWSTSGQLLVSVDAPAEPTTLAPRFASIVWTFAAGPAVLKLVARQGSQWVVVHESDAIQAKDVAKLTKKFVQALAGVREAMANAAEDAPEAAEAPISSGGDA